MDQWVQVPGLAASWLLPRLSVDQTKVASSKWPQTAQKWRSGFSLLFPSFFGLQQARDFLGIIMEFPTHGRRIAIGSKLAVTSQLFSIMGLPDGAPKLIMLHCLARWSPPNATYNTNPRKRQIKQQALRLQLSPLFLCRSSRWAWPSFFLGGLQPESPSLDLPCLASAARPWMDYMDGCMAQSLPTLVGTCSCS